MLTSTRKHLARSAARLPHALSAVAAACLFAASAVAVSATASSADTEAERCYADWSQAAEIVRAESLVTAKDVHERARTSQIGDVVRMTLCEEKGRFVYRLVIREAKGHVVKRTVDAKAPF